MSPASDAFMRLEHGSPLPRLLNPATAELAPSPAHCRPALGYGLDAAPSVRNVHTQMLVLDTGQHAFPVTVQHDHRLPGNSYVVSPASTYGAYAEFELRQLGWGMGAWPLLGLIRGMRLGLGFARIDQMVQVNNWLLSTNLYPPDWPAADLPDITRRLVQQFPQHAIGFRSINRFSNAKLMDRLLACGYIAVPSRQVYLFDARQGEASAFLQRHNAQLDARLLRRSVYAVESGEQLAPHEFERLETLYRLLYVEKYCPLNPQFSADWLRKGHREGWLQLRVLRHPQGHMDGVVGWFGNRDILTAPIVGYDTRLPPSVGLYRLLTCLCWQEAVARRCVLNFSSGAAHFKRLRGGAPEIEYSLVYIAHLSLHRQAVWYGLAQLLQTVAVPLMKKWQL